MSTNSEDVTLSSQCDLLKLFEQEAIYGIYRAIHVLITEIKTDIGITIAKPTKSVIINWVVEMICPGWEDLLWAGRFPPFPVACSP